MRSLVKKVVVAGVLGFSTTNAMASNAKLIDPGKNLEKIEKFMGIRSFENDFKVDDKSEEKSEFCTLSSKGHQDCANSTKSFKVVSKKQDYVMIEEKNSIGDTNYEIIVKQEYEREKSLFGNTEVQALGARALMENNLLSNEAQLKEEIQEVLIKIKSFSQNGDVGFVLVEIELCSESCQSLFLTFEVKRNAGYLKALSRSSIQGNSWHVLNYTK